MCNGNCARPPDAPGSGRVNPQELDLARALEVLDPLKKRIESTLPRKRSGYSYFVYVVLQACIQLAGGAVKSTIARLERACKNAGIAFQAFQSITFTNKKHRRFFPDQPSLSRCLKKIAGLGLTEVFWNEVNFAHLLLLKELGIIRADINIIADYKETRCPRDKDDPYCFGTKEGRTVHKTLVFSILSGGLHQVVFSFKVAKQQHKLPLFSKAVRQLQGAGFTIKHALVDRGFYRKELLTALQLRGISVIIPGRQCKETKTMIVDYLNGNAKRIGKGHMKLRYVKGTGYTYLEFDVLLCAKRKHNLAAIKTDYNNGKLSLDDAIKRIFPLVFLKGSNKGVTRVKGNESRIRQLYRARWNIEIAFREMNRLGLASRFQHRDGRLAAFGARVLVYNMWQVERYLLGKAEPASPLLELNEFLGRGCVSRRVQHAKIVGVEN